jgi:peroxiredoxin
MKKAILVMLAAVLAIAAVYGVLHHGGVPRPHSSATVQAQAPDFSLLDLDGKPVTLAGYPGQVVLLDFWATWCAPCRTEIPRLVEFQDRYHPQGLQVIGISMDDGPKPVRAFYQQFKMNYPVALGSEKLAASYGGVLGLPITFLIARDGKIAAKYVGAVEPSILEAKIQTLLQAK